MKNAAANLMKSSLAVHARIFLNSSFVHGRGAVRLFDGMFHEERKCDIYNRRI
jgi:hypothetical protein